MGEWVERGDIGWPADEERTPRRPRRGNADRRGRPDRRQGAVEPPSVAERHVHGARTEHGHGTPAEPSEGLDARNAAGVPIDPTDINGADGFSPGSMLIVKVPGLDNQAAFERSRLPKLRDIARSLRRRSPIVVLNARTGKRHPVWAELDSNATTDANRMLIIRPARNFSEGERYIVVLRDLKTASGDPISRGAGLRAGFRGGLRGFRRRGGFRALHKAG